MNGFALSIPMASLALMSWSAGASPTPGIEVETKPDIPITIIPVDRSSLNVLPAEIRHLTNLPEGSFVVVNGTGKAIMALVAVWNYTNSDGQLKKRRINCDGYLTQTPIAKDNEFSLITPTSYTSQELLPNLVAGDTFSGAVDDPTGRMSVKSDRIAPIRLYIDSIVFDDGEVWGPDKFSYFKVIEGRHNAIQEVAREVAAATESGESVESRIAKMRTVMNQGDTRALSRDFVIRLLQSTPNPKGMLRHLEEQKIPHFHHSGEN